VGITFELPFLFGKRSGESAQPAISPERVQLADTLHGKHYNDAVRGRVFHSSNTPLGTAIPIYTSTTPLGNALWNPLDSGVNVELISYRAARVSGTTAFGAICAMARKFTGVVAGPSAFAATTPMNGLFGSGNVSRIYSSAAGTCTIAAGVAGDVVRHLFAIYPAIDTTAIESSDHREDFDGTLILPPGTMFWVGATVASVALFAQTVVWKEIPTD
jgi:hypothetical protein